MTSHKYKLTYFNGRGLGERTRLLFHYAGVPFEDVRVTFEEWPSIKPNMPFGQLPVLEVDGEVIAQSKAIARYVARQLGLAGNTDIEQAQVDAYIYEMHEMFNYAYVVYREQDDSVKEHLKKTALEKIPQQMAMFEARLKHREFFVGTKITWADTTFMDMVKSGFLTSYLNNMEETFPNVCGHCQRIAEMPGIKEWLENRPQTSF